MWYLESFPSSASCRIYVAQREVGDASWALHLNTFCPLCLEPSVLGQLLFGVEQREGFLRSPNCSSSLPGKWKSCRTYLFPNWAHMATAEWNKAMRGWACSLKLFHTHREQSSFPREGPLLHFPGSGCSDTGTWGYSGSWLVKEVCSQIWLRLMLTSGTLLHPVGKPRSLHTATITNKGTPHLWQIKTAWDCKAGWSFPNFQQIPLKCKHALSFLCKEELSEMWGINYQITGCFPKSFLTIQ